MAVRLYGFDRYGGPEVQQFFDVAPPEPQGADLVVELVAAGLNPADVKVRSGQRVGKVAVHFPMAMGREAAGRVLVPGVSGFREGDLVFGSCADGFGALSQQVVLAGEQTVLVPDGVSAEQAAVLPVAVGTAWDALVETGVGPGDVVLVAGAGGGVGIHACQLAGLLGARVIGLASAAKRGAVERTGAEWLESGDDFAIRLRELSSGVDMVLDTVGAPVLERLQDSLRTPQRLRSTASPAAATQLGGSGVTRRRSGAVYAELAARVEDGSLTPVIGQVFDFEQSPDAVAQLETGHGLGKVVVTNAADRRTPLATR